MVSAVVTMPDGRRARLSGPTRKDVEAQAQRIVRAIERDTQGIPLLDDERALLGKTGSSKSRAPVTLPFGLGEFSVGGSARDFVRAASNVDDKTSTPVVLGTMGALATGGASLVPSVLGAGIGGGAGGALAESHDPRSTPGSIARQALRSGATMAGSEFAGFGLGAVARAIGAPNLGRYVDPMKPVREYVASTGVPQYLRGAASQLVGRLPRSLQRAGTFAASPIGGEVLEAAVVPGVTAAFGPLAGAGAYALRAAFAPGVVQRYLSNSRLPNAVVRGLGRRAATTAFATGLSEHQKSDEEWHEHYRRNWKHPE